MQTFLPYPDFAQSARVLDMRRLGKQRVEAKQIYLALTDPSYGWQNHPAVKMWRGHCHALACYGWIVCDEWIQRGYKDTLRTWFMDKMVEGEQLRYNTVNCPRWLGDVNFHRSHQSNLLRKDHEYYFRFFPDVPDNLPYIWPTAANDNENT